MFGLIVAGRLVQTDIQQMSETHFLFNIPDANNANHIVVFMTGATPLPDTMGVAVHFGWPGAGGPSWKFLGFINNAKPSAVFKITNLRGTTTPTTTASPFGQFGMQGGMTSNPFGQPAMGQPTMGQPTMGQPALGQPGLGQPTLGQPGLGQPQTAQIGLSVEPLVQLQQMTPANNANPSLVNSFTEFAQKTVQSLFNYTASFGVTQQQMQPNPGETYVPISTLRNWYENFQRRLQQNPYFWKT